MQISAGWEDKDFGNRLTTFLGVRRLHFFIKDNHTAMFVYDALQDIIDNIVAV
jgi:hypothetical protein